MVIGMALALPPSASAQVVDIPDPELQKAIRVALDTPTGDITVEDMESLTELDASRGTRGFSAPMIQSLEGLQEAKNLRVLDLSGYSDGPGLWISINCDIHDSTALVGLTELAVLRLRMNDLTTVLLPQDLSGLKELDLRYNQLTNTSFLEGLTDSVRHSVRYGTCTITVTSRIRLG
jgi:Leucine-rich repeat (LRR) protein